MCGYRGRYPRVYELRDLIADPDDPNCYFQGFERSLDLSSAMRARFDDLSHALQRLDENAWRALKGNAEPYLCVKHQWRGWHQLFNVLNEAYAYCYLLDTGCHDVQFIPRAKPTRNKTPDVMGQQREGAVLCEVKTLNVSDYEITARKSFAVRDGTQLCTLSPEFFKKLSSDLERAASQLRSYLCDAVIRRIVYAVINFDDWTTINDDGYQEQLDCYRAAKPSADIEVVFHNRGSGLRF